MMREMHATFLLVKLVSSKTLVCLEVMGTTLVESESGSSSCTSTVGCRSNREGGTLCTVMYMQRMTKHSAHKCRPATLVQTGPR